MFKDKDIYNKNNINFTGEVFATWAGICLTALATCFFFREIGVIISDAWKNHQWLSAASHVIFILICLCLIYGNLLYQFARVGYFKRLRKHQPASNDKLDIFYTHPAPKISILIPSYKEETRTIRQTLFSAALQSYPNRRVVLLIDDPPQSKNAQDFENLAAARRLPKEIEMLLDRQHAYCEQALSDFLQRQAASQLNCYQEHGYLIRHYQNVIRWFEIQKENWPVYDHSDHLFIELTFQSRLTEFRLRVQGLQKGLDDASGLLLESEIDCEYRRLATLFLVQISSFERKLYENLSHEPNKAMNLNSYISLMGGRFRELAKNDALHLAPSEFPESLCFPDAKYLVTLDADSLLTPDYALRLAYIMQDPANERLAVVQTPYSAIPNAPTLIERISGATTDMQYLIHQGFTKHNATFWVGANALLRKKALEDIKVFENERGYRIAKYIQDRTVIEDTESSIDLAAKGWELQNYPERLSYSATPPDFGALIIQRERWANGGLLIFPKFLRYVKGKGISAFKHIGEIFMRTHYLTSIAAVNLGVLILLLFPFEKAMHCLWLPLTSVPYYFFYGRDLLQAGYGRKDLFRVYVMNLFLIPVNICGVLKSLEQAKTGKKIPFKRTPKILQKTGAPIFYVIIECVFVVYIGGSFFLDCARGLWMHALFSFTTAGCFLYAVLHFVGIDDVFAIFSLQRVSSSARRDESIDENIPVPIPSKSPKPRFRSLRLAKISKQNNV